MMEVSELFPKSYDSSRSRFYSYLEKVRESWPTAELREHCLNYAGDDSITIDWIAAEALRKKHKLFILTTGEHGVEGYIGSAVMHMFIAEFLSGLSPEDTGLVLLHTINPWGMKHKRRTNQKNVDLNRNFLMDDDGFDQTINPEYGKFGGLVNPDGEIGNLYSAKLSFYLHLIKWMILMGIDGLRAATLLGQYRFPKGIYYGGDGIQEETRAMMTLYEKCFTEYEHIVHLDMHTGYGPRYQMSLVNSTYNSSSSDELAAKYAYPLVVKANRDEFYAMQGDMIDYEYLLIQEKFSGKRFYAVAFEFGTYGDSFWAVIRSLRTMVLENRLFWHGAKTMQSANAVDQEFLALFAPQERRWRSKAISDARQAFRGILKAEGYLK